MKRPAGEETRLARWAAVLMLSLVPAVAQGGVGAWTSGGPSASRITALAVDTQFPAVVYSGTSAVGTNGVFKSGNAGQSWVSVGLSQYTFEALESGPSAVVYAGSFGGADFKSVDGGSSWDQIRPNHSCSATTFFRVDPQNSSVVYAEAAGICAPSGPPGGQLLRSVNGGQEWVDIQGGLGFGIVADLAIDPMDTATLYAVTPSGFFKSRNSGSTWTRLENGLPFPGLTSLAISSSMPDVIYAGSAQGVFRSLDAGSTFSRISAGLPANGVTAIVIHPEAPSQLYAATEGAGIYASGNSGATWTEFNTGLTNLSVRELKIDPTGAFLHAATGAGVFDHQLAGTDTALVLNQGHRFVVQLSARNPRTAMTSAGVATPVGELAGYFSIPDLTGSPATPEVFVKVVDGRAINGAFWFFHGALTDLEYTLTVTEEGTGRVRTYSKAAGSACGGIDTSAFGP